MALSIVIGSGLWLCPESPWHLAHKGKLAQAEKLLKSLTIVDGAKIVAQMGAEVRCSEIATMSFLMHILS